MFDQMFLLGSAQFASYILCFMYNEIISFYLHCVFVSSPGLPSPNSGPCPWAGTMIREERLPFLTLIATRYDHAIARKEVVDIFAKLHPIQQKFNFIQ